MPPSRVLHLRRLLLALGGVLIFGDCFVADALLRGRHEALHFALLPCGCACLLAAWSLEPSGRWLRLGGMTASILLICGFPWLAPFTLLCGSIMAAYLSVTMVAPQPPASAGASR